MLIKEPLGFVFEIDKHISERYSSFSQIKDHLNRVCASVCDCVSAWCACVRMCECAGMEACRTNIFWQLSGVVSKRSNARCGGRGRGEDGRIFRIRAE